ncbi:MAG: formylglycine-generating enzyme family protein [Bacteroidales bacterium]|nr:formylglycine-generating enzyme family protein [Bacteroidales bacterium]
MEFINDLKSQNKSLLHKCIPDSAQWKNHNSDTYNEPMVNMYNWHPAYSMYPVVNITKEAMELYCKWKTEQYNSLTDKDFSQVVYRLPTEKEWLKISAPKLGYELPWIDDKPYEQGKGGKYCTLANLKIMDFSNNTYNYSFDGAIQTNSVGSYKLNNLGIYDIIGNVSEMTSNGTIKGGSWFNTQEESLVSNYQDYKLPSPCVGSRVVIEVIME